jgi:hypothetical protein
MVSGPSTRKQIAGHTAKTVVALRRTPIVGAALFVSLIIKGIAIGLLGVDYLRTINRTVRYAIFVDAAARRTFDILVGRWSWV